MLACIGSIGVCQIRHSDDNGMQDALLINKNTIVERETKDKDKGIFLN